MGFFLGKDSGVRFTSETRPGSVFTLFANEWSISKVGEKIDITNIEMLRDNNVIHDLSAVDDWHKYGIPKISIDDGITDTVFSCHGFLFFDDNFTLADGAQLPKKGERGKFEVLYKTPAGARRTLWKMDSCVIVKAEYNTDISTGIEWDLEAAPLTSVMDTDPYPRTQ